MINKRPKGRNIEECLDIVDQRAEIGHLKADTVVGKRNGKGTVVFTFPDQICAVMNSSAV